MFGPHLDGSWGDIPFEEADMLFTTPAANANFGVSFAHTDLDGDGLAEWVFGAPYGTEQAYVWFGTSLTF